MALPVAPGDLVRLLAPENPARHGEKFQGPSKINYRPHLHVLGASALRITAARVQLTDPQR